MALDPPMSGLAGAAGGMADAVGAIIEQRLRQGQLAETIRSHQVDEANRAAQLADSAAWRKAQEDENVRWHNLEDAKNTAAQGEKLNESTPEGTDFPASSKYAPFLSSVPKMVQAQAPPDALAADPNAGPENLPGTIANAPSPVLAGMLRTKTPTYKQQHDAETEQLRRDLAQTQIDARNPARQQYLNTATGIFGVGDDGKLTPVMDPSNPGKQLQQYHTPPSVSVLQIPTIDDQGNPEIKVVSKADALGKTFAGRPTAQSQRQQQGAQNALGDIDEVSRQIDLADQAGLLGPGPGRIYGKFLAGDVGSTGDPAADKQLGLLKGALDNLRFSYPGAIAAAGGGRGGVGLVNKMDELINSDKMSADLMRGLVSEFRSGAARRSAKPSATTPTGDGGGVKVLSITPVQQP